MDIFYFILLALHIAFGFTALGTGLTAIVSRKGKGSHRRAGRLYFWCMVGVAISAFLMCSLRFNPFLFVVAFFSLYMTITGERTLRFKKDDHPYGIFDVVFLILTALGGIAFFAYLLTRWSISHPVMPVLLTFAGFLLAMLVGDAVFFAGFRKKLPRNYWLIRHISRMMGAYIATLTAFLVTNFTTDPMWIGWLAPTAVFTPVIQYFQRKYRIPKKVSASQPA